MTAAAFSVAGLHVYPLKSGAGVTLDSVRLEQEGPAGDRRMMVVDENGVCVTARATRKLMQVRTQLDGDEVVLVAPGVQALVVHRAGLRRTAPVTIWGDDVVALDGGDAAALWLSAFLDRPCRLVLKGDETHRPLALEPGGMVSFADTAPLLLTNSASLAELNRYLEVEVEMARFRPNLVVAGPPAFDEDAWSVVRVGDVEFDVAGACDRCVMVTLDPHTGEARNDHEPLAMLGRQRRGEDGKAYFGQFLVPRKLGRLHVGDPVEVIARKPSIKILPGTATSVTRLPSTAQGSGQPAQSRERALRCVGVIDEAHDFRTFRFALEPGEAIDYKPGQFITLLLDIGGERVRRNYTISSSPSRPHHLSVTVRRVEDGRVSNWLHENMKPGDTIRSLGPNGRFHLAASGGAERLLMLSAGSGVTPMISMLRFITDANLPLDVHFHNSARGIDDIAFLDELLLLRRQMGPRLRLSWNLTGRDVDRHTLSSLATRAGLPEEPFFVGRLDQPMLERVCPDLAERVVFCCGPDGFREKAREIHETWPQAPKHAFLEETFGPDRSAVPLPEIGDYRVSFLKSGKAAAGQGTVTLLALARQAGVTVPADCEAGICGTCRCRLVSGDWRIAANAADPERSVLSEAEKQDGYVLACSTSPIGNVEIEL